ncbi:MAG TPA: S9 family peptidase [Tangfeifania sp.]|nr:S9 family peptidase [Tangfeifania sp.]
MKQSAFIILAIILSLNLNAQTGEKITFEDIFQKGTFRAESVKGLRSMKDGENYTTLENGTRVVKNSYETGEEVETLFDITKIEDAPISSFSNYEFSEDETKILLTTDIDRIYRHSYTAQYYVWNSVTEDFIPLSENGPQQLATFSPDGDRVAFVRENNLFIKNLKFGNETQITHDGEKNKIINGAPDWVYEEEFGFNKAFWWSPDSKFLAFIRFDETEVPEFSMTMYAGQKPQIDSNRIYPSLETFKYPKAGEKNSDVTVHTYELYSRTTMDVDLGDMNDFYVPRLKWTPDAEDLVIMRVNRRQNQVDVLYANPYTGDSRPILTEKNDKYISEEFYDAYTYLDDGRFVIQSERNGWSHLYLYDRLGFLQGQLTKGEFDVTDFYGYDKDKELFYYQAAAESPLRREVYFINEEGDEKGKLSKLAGTSRADFSENFNYYVMYYSSNETPTLISLYENGKRSRDKELVRVLQDNTVLKNKLQNFDIPQKEFFQFTTSEGIELNGYMIKPEGFNETKKYPVLITQYSGPNSQSVKDSWSGIGWNHYLAQEGFLIVSVDPRGTAARGEAFRKATYLQLGKYESDDMVETAKYLETLPYVDDSNIGIFGWSYGGFMTCLTMEKGGSLFKAGIAVAPVTNWRFYDTIYTERYMRTPQENPEGYDQNSPLFFAGDIEGRLLIVHGSADDNVHAQNTYEFTEKLVQAGVQFDMAIYTNRAHGIRGGNTTMHLYTKMTNFLKNQLQ